MPTQRDVVESTHRALKRVDDRARRQAIEVNRQRVCLPDHEALVRQSRGNLFTKRPPEMVLKLRAIRTHPYKNRSFVEFSLCLSRACLGKMILFDMQSKTSTVVLPWLFIQLAIVGCCAKHEGSTSSPPRNKSGSVKICPISRRNAARNVYVAFAVGSSTWPNSPALVPCGKHVFSFSVCLCLSRACLGQSIVFELEWPQKGVFRTGHPTGSPGTPRQRPCPGRSLRKPAFWSHL